MAASKTPSAKQLMLDKLSGSDLTAKDAATLKIKPLSPQETRKLSATFHQVEAMQIPYFDFTGKVTKFFRVRYLGELGGFAGLLAKPQRYVQPPNTLNEVYMPPMRDWQEERDNPGRPLYITEGELKAACACKHGFATIGLGGVDVWRSTKRGIEFLPQLEAISWNGKSVFIVFDSDAATNPNVLRAQLKLARMLTDRGAMPRVINLPEIEKGRKTGLDDWLLAKGPKSMESLELNAQDIGEASALWGLNSEVVYVRDPGVVVEQSTGLIITPGAFKEHAYSNRHHIVIEQNAKGETRMVEEKTAPTWLEWPCRFELRKMTYAPGKDRIHDSEWNLWTGWGCEPLKGDVTPWTKLLDHIFNGDKAGRTWFEQWCAYPLQHPGAKMFNAVLLWGVETGTGKSLIGYSLMDIYGSNSSEIHDDDLRGSFNEWARHRQFVMGEEITGNDSRAEADRIKGMITRERIIVKAKYVPEYNLPDCINYYFTSNHPDALFLEDADRRFFVHRVVCGKMPMQFYADYDKWRRKQGGPSALFHHLLNLNLKGFDPRSPAPLTHSKLEMISDAKSELGAWVQQLRESPTHALRALGATVAAEAALLTSAQLLRCYDPENATRVTANGMGRELTRAGFEKANNGHTITTVAGSQRMWIVRNIEAWKKAAPVAQAHHWNDLFGPKKAKFK